MIDLNELKRLADATYDTSLTISEYRDAFSALMENVDAEIVCKLLAIQAQLVEALQMAGFYVSGEGSHEEKFMVFTALAAAGAQP